MTGERGALGREAVAFGLQVVMTGGDLIGAALQLGWVDQPGLVEVDQPSFGCRGVGLAVEAGEFGGK